MFCSVQASILGHMERLGLIQPHTCYIEFGAGRGTQFPPYLYVYYIKAHSMGGTYLVCVCVCVLLLCRKVVQLCAESVCG